MGPRTPARNLARQVGMYLLLGPLVLASCTSPPRAPSGSCIQQTMDSLKLGGLAGDRQHCVASGTIALRCGRVSAFTAGYGKELADFFGPGLVQRRDIRANAGGRDCAARVTGEGDLAACCAASGY